MTDKKVLVTGGCGFIGKELCENLSDLHREVISVDNLSSGNINRKPEGVRNINMDINDSENLYNLFESFKPDIVFHLAAHSNVNADSIYLDNIKMTRSLINACNDSIEPDIFFSSSGSIYGYCDGKIQNDNPPNPESMYAASKVACESLLSVYSNKTSADFYSLRLSNVVGSGLRNAVVPDFVEKVKQDAESLEILGDGRQTKPYIYDLDCVMAMIEIEKNRPRSKYINISTKDTLSVDKIADIVEEVTDTNPDRFYTGGKRGWAGDVPRMSLETTELDKIGWSPTKTSEEAVRKSAEELDEEIQANHT